MIPRRRYDLVLALYPQSRGFSFVLFEGSLSPVNWGVHEARGPRKNAWCLNKINGLLDLYMPEVVVLQNMSDREAHRTSRIKELNERVADLADRRGMVVWKYSRAKGLDELGASTKQGLAETIAKHVPALSLYVPPQRKPWMTENPRMGIFEAAALAWMYFHESEGKRQAA